MRHRYLNVTLIFTVSLAFLLALEHYARPFTEDGVHFQSTSSSRMMQSLDIKELKSHPIQSLWYLHIQPPMLDTIRALISTRHNPENIADLEKLVDKDMYVLFAIGFALMNSLIYVWFSKIIGKAPGFIFCVIWMLNPSAIYYATYLDSTFLSSLGVLWLFYEIYLISGNAGSISRLIIASLFLFFIRTAFQWPFFLLLVVILWLKKVPIKRIALFSAVVFTIIAVFLIKQYCLFGTTSTTTFKGYHLLGLIKYRPSVEEKEDIKKSVSLNYPEKAETITEDLYNSRRVYEDNAIYSTIFKNKLLSDPIYVIKKTTLSMKQSFMKFLESSHRRQPKISNKLTTRLFYAHIYDWLFSDLRLMVLMLGPIIFWLKRINRSTLSLILPALYIIIVVNLANIHGWVESNRLKFLIEPVHYIFIVTSWTFIIRELRRHLIQKNEKAQHFN